MDLSLLDHIIVCDGSYYSYADEGRLIPTDERIWRINVYLLIKNGIMNNEFLQTEEAIMLDA